MFRFGVIRSIDFGPGSAHAIISFATEPAAEAAATAMKGYPLGGCDNRISVSSKPGQLLFFWENKYFFKEFWETASTFQNPQKRRDRIEHERIYFCSSLESIFKKQN